MAEQDRQFFSEVMPEVFSGEFFENIEPSILPEMKAEMRLVELSGGTILFQSGDPADAMYFLARGMLEVTIPQADGSALRLDMLEPGASVGETALLTGQARSATVSAMVDSLLVQLSREGFDRLAAKEPAAMQRFAQTILPRIQRTQLAAALAHLFGPLDARVVHAIQQNTTWMHLPAGEVLIHKGDPGDSMYIVINGRLRLLDDADPTSPREMGVVGRGESVGEFALLTGEPRSATVIAQRDTDVVCLNAAYLAQLVDAFPKLLLEMTRSIVRRSQVQAGAHLAGGAAVHTLAILPATPGLLLDDFCSRLAAAFGADGDALVLDSTRFELLFGRPGAAQLPSDHPMEMVINNWLTGSEMAHRFLIYVADPVLTEWTRRCLRQADRLVLVAQAGGEPNPWLADPFLQSAFQRTAPDLVLMHPQETARPRGSASWLARLAPHSLHHLRLGVRQDFRRLARRLTGKGVGLVLSGGGARGFAHLGALRAMEEAGVEIDLIGGTSMGALIGAAYAMDWDAARILEMVRMFASPRRLLDYTLPYTSLAATFKVSAMLHEVFGEVQIEDLWRPYFCLSTNLSRAEPVIHQTGPLWQAVRASIAIPGIFAPLLLDGDLLVDGGVMNNFPVDIMRQVGEAGYVVGVNTSPKKEKPRNYQFGAGLSGWQILWSKINPLAARVRAPSILSSLMRATEASSIYRNPLLQQEANLVILPSVAEYSSLSFGDYEQIIQQGYLAARPKVDEIVQMSG